MSRAFKIRLKVGERAEVFTGEAGGFRLVVWRLKSLADARTIPPAETRRATGKGFDTVARPRYQRGCVFQRGNAWVLRYREDIILADGSLGRVHHSEVLGFLKQLDGIPRERVIGPLKKTAFQVAESRLRPHNAGAVQPQAAITLRNFWDDYFVPQIFPSFKFSTQRLYRALWSKHWARAFGKRKMSEISRLQIQQFFGQKQGGHAPQTLRHLRNLLSNLFGTAMSWGFVNDNPARGIKLPPMERVRQSRVLSSEEVARFLDAFDDPLRVIFLLGLLGALRVGELLALRLQDVDLFKAMVYVRRNVYCGHVGTPKTESGERRIPLAAVLVPLLGDWRKVREGQSEWLFPSEAGTPLHDRNLLRRKVWPVCDRLEIPRFGWHSLRHTFATLAANNGVPLLVLKLLLGHTGSDVTMLYVHSLEREARQAVETVAGVLFPSVPISRQFSVVPETAKVRIQ